MKPTAMYFLLLPALLAAASPDAVLQRAINSTLYRMDPEGAGYVARNQTQHLTAHFNQGITEFRHGTHRFSFALAGAGPVNRTTVNGNRLSLHRAGVTEWFVNEPAGLEQGFTFERKPAAGPLTVTLRVGGELRPELRGAEIALRDDSRIRLRYEGLKSWDATGKPLPSRMEVDGRDILLIVDDTSARYPVTVDPTIKEDKLFTSTEGTAAALNQGDAVAMDGDTVIVGATAWHSSQGAAYVFVRSGGIWTEQGRLTAPDGVADDLFGVAVAISGDTAIVGAEQKDNYAGAAYVFVRAGATWTFQQRLPVVLSASDYFGVSVSIRGQTAVVGARSEDPAGNGRAGSAYIFARSGSTWTEQRKLTGSPSDESFGLAVAISGDTIVVGGKNFAHFFVLVNGNWTEPFPKLVGGVNHNFGISAAVSGDLAIIGGVRSMDMGAAYVYTRTGGNWSPTPATITSPDLQAGDFFGFRVGLSGNMAVVGAPAADANRGAAYVFTRAGANWTQVARLTASDGLADDNFGYSVAVAGNTVIAGAPIRRVTPGGKSIGAAYAYTVYNASILSTPSGRSFALGSDCPNPGTHVTPYYGLWTTCTVRWPTSDTSVPGTRYTFQNWSDGDTSIRRTLPGDWSYTANFLTEYSLTGKAVPVSGGTVTGDGWYKAGTSAAVVAVPNPGFVFTGFPAPINSTINPQTVTMSGPLTATGNFTPTPPAVLSALVTAKSGTADNRQWTLTLTNTGPGIAYNAQVFGLVFTQTFGTVCTAVPIRLSPLSLPVSLGSLNGGAAAQMNVALDFTGCPSNARFTVGVGYMANGGSSAGMFQLVNQFQ